MHWCDELVHFLYDVKRKLKRWTKRSNGVFQIRSEHKQKGQILRGHPDYRQSGEWQDWVLVNWGGDTEPEPAHIWCFMVVRGLPKTKDKREKHRDKLRIGSADLHDGVYAVAECAAWATGPRAKTRLFPKLTLEMASNAPGSTSKRRRFYLIDTETIAGPCCVVPDIGSKNKRDFFHVKGRDAWISMFDKFLQEEQLPQDYHDDPSGLKFNKPGQSAAT